MAHINNEWDFEIIDVSGDYVTVMSPNGEEYVMTVAEYDKAIETREKRRNNFGS